MTISEPQPSAILVPAGTRVTDAGRTLYWETEENVYIRPGDSYVDVTAVCQTVGTSGNGYAIGKSTGWWMCLTTICIVKT